MKFLRDLFGIRRRRINVYKVDYKNMNEEQRVQFQDMIRHHAIHDIFRNQNIIDQCNAAIEVEGEEEETAKCRVLH